MSCGGFAKQYKVLITVRSRGYEALRWGDDAFFKPEQIKTKTVNWIDVEFLDYGDDIGRLVIQRPIAVEAKLLRTAPRGGRAARAPRFREVMTRYQLRVKEWRSKASACCGPVGRRTGQPRRTWSRFNWSENLDRPVAGMPRERSTDRRAAGRETKRIRNGKEVVIPTSGW